MSSCFKDFVLAPFYKETWVVGFPELWELTSAWFCSNSAMMRRNPPNFLISYLNPWVVLPGPLLEKPLLLILHTNLQAEEHFHGNLYLNISTCLLLQSMSQFYSSLPGHLSEIYIASWMVLLLLPRQLGERWANASVLPKAVGTNSAIEILGNQWEHLKQFCTWFCIFPKPFSIAVCSC